MALEIVSNAILSDVHLLTTNSDVSRMTECSELGSKRRNLKISTFSARIPERTDEHEHGNTVDVEYDDDGDFVIQRRKCTVIKIPIVHTLQTSLYDVGLQVWNGALLLCDYLLHEQSLLHGQRVLDLGAGVGLTSIVSARTACHVYCTDYNEDSLSIARHNITMNSHISLTQAPLPVTVVPLDWLKIARSIWGSLSRSGDKQNSEGASHTLDDRSDHTREAYERILRDCSIVIAADVIYDDDLTDAFFTTLYTMLSKRSITVLISLEKRFVFTTRDLDVVSPAYSHFRECLGDMESLSNDQVEYHISQICVSFPQYFDYNRSSHLELWKIVSTHSKETCSIGA